tara:strand:+ start:1384 stop:1695 length:312 start_codon:yes stop_codon:yes gene_type:complete
MKIYEVKHTVISEWFDNKAAALAAVKATETETTGGPIAQMITREVGSGRKALVEFLNDIEKETLNEVAKEVLSETRTVIRKTASKPPEPMSQEEIDEMEAWQN